MQRFSVYFALKMATTVRLKRAVVFYSKILNFLLTFYICCDNILWHLERYRSGHNEAVLKTVWGQPHKGSNPFLSAKKAPIFGAFSIVKGENYVEFNTSRKYRISTL